MSFGNRSYVAFTLEHIDHAPRHHEATTFWRARGSACGSIGTYLMIFDDFCMVN